MVVYTDAASLGTSDVHSLEVSQDSQELVKMRILIVLLWYLL